MTEVYVDRFEILVTWWRWYTGNRKWYSLSNEWDTLLEVIYNLENNPLKLITLGREQGWWKK
jgi:hypothetical protein